MKKHIIGFAIFSLIVSSAVLIKALFYFPKENTVSYSYSTKNSCWKMKKELSQTEVPIIRQAVFDLNTKQMDWELIVPATKSSIGLHFFVKDSKGTRYLATEIAPKSALNKSSYDNEVLEFTSSYEWLDNLNSYQNLYVVPEKISGFDYQKKNFRPNFDENTATSVLLYSGKAGYPTEKYFKK